MEACHLCIQESLGNLIEAIHQRQADHLCLTKDIYILSIYWFIAGPYKNIGSTWNKFYKPLLYPLMTNKVLGSNISDEGIQNDDQKFCQFKIGQLLSQLSNWEVFMLLLLFLQRIYSQVFEEREIQVGTREIWEFQLNQEQNDFKSCFGFS